MTGFNVDYFALPSNNHPPLWNLFIEFLRNFNSIEGPSVAQLECLGNMVYAKDFDIFRRLPNLTHASIGFEKETFDSQNIKTWMLTHLNVRLVKIVKKGKGSYEVTAMTEVKQLYLILSKLGQLKELTHLGCLLARELFDLGRVPEDVQMATFYIRKLKYIEVFYSGQTGDELAGTVGKGGKWARIFRNGNNDCKRYKILKGGELSDLYWYRFDQVLCQ
ncbi:hypothetical protein M422DRAFT_55601 [Sphaerobolus stellatus SS14]|uniref:Uncharacterized protein n=1 Tax=Sphaerobolus stellatus (strain SS14) TaxID=990650 RepID=A0A0C9ULG6_SPHS4|nr:hypothetical protein M422DRAFT_55601 [Sphaerobolus stellatus SS14]